MPDRSQGSSPRKRPKKPLPKWIDPVLVAGFSAMAVYEYSHDQMIWFWIWVVAAAYTLLTALFPAKPK